MVKERGANLNLKGKSGEVNELLGEVILPLFMFCANFVLYRALCIRLCGEEGQVRSRGC